VFGDVLESKGPRHSSGETGGTDTADDAAESGSGDVEREGGLADEDEDEDEAFRSRYP
jgi:hypothetical protein